MRIERGGEGGGERICENKKVKYYSYNNKIILWKWKRKKNMRNCGNTKGGPVGRNDFEF